MSPSRFVPVVVIGRRDLVLGQIVDLPEHPLSNPAQILAQVVLGEVVDHAVDPVRPRAI